MELRVGVERVRSGAARGASHAVPAVDRTRSAVCGASVRRTATPWRPAPDACPDCLALLRLSRSA